MEADTSAVLDVEDRPCPIPVAGLAKPHPARFTNSTVTNVNFIAPSNAKGATQICVAALITNEGQDHGGCERRSSWVQADHMHFISKASSEEGRRVGNVKWEFLIF